MLTYAAKLQRVSSLLLNRRNRVCPSAFTYQNGYLPKASQPLNQSGHALHQTIGNFSGKRKFTEFQRESEAEINIKKFAYEGITRPQGFSTVSRAFRIDDVRRSSNVNSRAF